jgi:hypothetical protein
MAVEKESPPMVYEVIRTIRTVDVMGHRETLVIPVYWSDDRISIETGWNAFDVEDYIVPALYRSVSIECTLPIACPDLR